MVLLVVACGLCCLCLAVSASCATLRVCPVSRLLCLSSDVKVGRYLSSRVVVVVVVVVVVAVAVRLARVL